MKIYLFLLCSAIVLSAWRMRAFAAEFSDTYSFKVGNFEVTLLSEGENDGNVSVLLGADEAMVERYAPKGTYPTAVNAFLLRTAENLILVDTGFGRKLFRNMEKLGVSPDQIDAVFLTHMHGDHIGGLLLGGKAAFPRAKLYLAEQERGYWTDRKLMSTLPKNQQGGFESAQKALAAYGSAVQTFDPEKGGALLPGVAPVAAFGHTPGHTLYMVESNGEKLLIWGDLTHAMAIQMPAPQVAMTYDVDPQRAVSSRQAVLKRVSEENIPVAGMHVPYPGIGKIASSPEGGYTFSAFP